MIRKYRLSARMVMPLAIAVAGMTAMAGTAAAQAGGSSHAAASSPIQVFSSVSAMAKAAPAAAPAIAPAPQAGSAPSAAALAADDALFFYTGTDGTVNVGGLSPVIAPSSLGGQFNGGPGATAVPPGSIGGPSGGFEVFGRGLDNALWSFTGAGWVSVGGNLTSKPGAAAGTLTGVPNGQAVDVFVRGTDGALWNKEFYANSQRGWVSLGGHIAAGVYPAAVNINGTLYAFVVGTDNALWYTSTTDGVHWTGFKSLGGTLSGPSAASPAAGAGIAFARWTDNTARYNQFLGATAAWKSLGGHITTGTGAAGAGGRVWVLALGSDNRIWGRTGVWPTLGPWTKVF